MNTTKLWIARDKNGELYGYNVRPYKINSSFQHFRGNWYKLDDELFPEVTFENSPQEVELKLIK